MTTPTKRVPNARGSGDLLRQEILDAAARILEETGREDALSLRAVAREVGISAPSVYLHFKNRTDLISTVLDGAYQALSAELEEAGRTALSTVDDRWAQIDATAAAYRRFAIDRPRRYRLMFSLEYEPSREATDTPLGAVLQAWTNAVDAYLAAHAPDRRSESEIIGIHLWTALHGQLALWRTLPGHHNDSEAILVQLEQSLLRRLLPAPIGRP